MSTGVGIKSESGYCYKCDRRLKLLEMTCPHCGADNSGLKILNLLEKLIASIFLVGFGVMGVSLVISLLGAMGAYNILPPGIKAMFFSVDRFLFFAVSNFNAIFLYAFVLFFALIALTITGNSYRGRLKAKDENAIKNYPPSALPNLKYAKKNFTSGQYKFIQFGFYLLFFDIIFTVISGGLATIFLQAGWPIVLVVLSIILNFISIPIFIIAYILYFILLAKAEGKKIQEQNSEKNKL